MRSAFKASFATTLVACTIGLAAPAVAADLGGSVKDGYVPVGPAPVAAGPCYFRADTGYSWSKEPNATYAGNIDPTIWEPRLANSWLFEAGVGCGSGSKGMRGELVVGMRTHRDFSGYYTDFTPPVPIDPLLTTTLRSYTAMFNAYYDLGRMGPVVPYIGAGVGFAYHRMSNVVSDVSPNPQFGEDKLSFAWSLMAGLAFQVSDRAVIDIGYRFIDMGSARSAHGDSALAWNPRLEIDDIRAHEIKIGLRYHFGSTGDCCGPQPYK